MIDRRGNPDRKLARLTETNARLRRQLAEPEPFWRIAHQDPLTELWNRRYADVRLAEEFGRAQTVVGYTFSVVVADVDDLKRINDRDGHAAGDQALKWAATFLTGGLRADDVCCRIGGDEFLLILPACGENECRRFVKRLRVRWQADARADERGSAQAVAISVGTASYPTHGATVEVLCAVADAAMYEDKRRTRSRSATGRLGGQMRFAQPLSSPVSSPSPSTNAQNRDGANPSPSLERSRSQCRPSAAPAVAEAPSVLRVKKG
jgi:diguanylate cyclase (GGDEF)-like protein